MKRVVSMLAVVLLIAGSLTAEERPNVIVIMADDLGYADVGFQGCKDIHTPNIDQLAASGARFTQGYVTGCMCGPSRAGFITGRNQSTFGYYKNASQPLDPKQGLPAGTKTVAHFLQEQGYITGGVGKWHMGTADHQHPDAMGYSDWFGFLGGGLMYYPLDHPSYAGKYLKKTKPWGLRDMHHTLPMLHNGKQVEWNQYLTRELTDGGVRFIEENRDRPFFLFVSYNAPHEYLEAPAETIAKYPAEGMTPVPGVPANSRSIYAAMVDEMDQGIGRLMETLERHELSENTIVWFLSDHGGLKRTSDNRPLRGAKGNAYEGGLRVPFVVRWPKRIAPGTVLDDPVTSLDIGATSLALGGGNIQQAGLDGKDITNYMTGTSPQAPHDVLYWHTGSSPKDISGVLRDGDYKMLVQRGRAQLFNIKADPSEATDLAKTHPARVEQMLSRWKEWNKKSLPPLWESKSGRQAKDKYQYADYEWLKGTPHYKPNEPVTGKPTSREPTHDKKPLRVYVLAGQSNMVGTGAVSSLNYLADDPATVPLLKRILNAEGEPRTCERVWISSLNGKQRKPGGVGQGKLSPGYGLRREDPSKPGDCIGPEYVFGISMEESYDGPILLIKTAWGGHSLHIEYRPPSAGEFVMPNTMTKKLKAKGPDVLAKKQAELKAYTGKYYHRMIDHVHAVLEDIASVVPDYDESIGYELSGFVWFQGWNDYVATDVYSAANGDQQYASYSDLLCRFVRDVRADLKTPELPFVIGVMGINGTHTPGLYSGPSDAKTRMERFRKAMTLPASLPEFRGSVVAVPTAPFWDDKLGALGMKQLKIQRMRRSLQNKSPSGPNANGTMSSAEIRKFMEEYNAEVFTPEDLAFRKRASGSGGFVHYYGSAKFHALAGQTFARALQDLEEQKLEVPKK